MEKSNGQTHSTGTYLYAGSKIFESVSFYGLRFLISFTMTFGVLQLEEMEALRILGWVSALLIISQIIGAALGDLLLGNKAAVIIGAIMQALGAFSLCIPTTVGLYIGLFLVVLGGGLFTPNIISNFGKLYLNKTKLLDSGFTLFYLATNLGAIAGPLLIGYFGEYYGWNIGFIIAGILMLASLIPILVHKENDQVKIPTSGLPTKRRALYIVIALVFVGLFWAIHEISSIRISDLQFQLSEISTLGIPKTIWPSLYAVIALPLGLIAIVLWTYFYSNQFFKLMLGFIFGAISFGILLLIPEIPAGQHTALYLLALLFLGISEIHIAPIVHSILTQYANPKYLAILVSLALIPPRLFSILIGLFNEGLLEKPVIAIVIGTVAMAFLSIGLIIFNRTNEKLPAPFHNKS